MVQMQQKEGCEERKGLDVYGKLRRKRGKKREGTRRGIAIGGYTKTTNRERFDFSEDQTQSRD